MSVKYISGSNTNNNGGTVVLGGNISDNGAITNAPDMEILGAGAEGNELYGPSTYNGTKKAVSAGSFGELPVGKYIILRGNTTSELAGVSTDKVNEAADSTRKSINSITSRKTVLIDSWDYATGEPTYNANNPSDDDFGDDDAATPSASKPGELTFLYGSPTPEMADYAERTLW